jgi:alpha-1,2-mannosyltransferase
MPGAPRASGMRAWLSRSPFGAARLRAYWLTGPGVAIMIATAVAIGLRLFNLLRPGYLTGVTEYDDGVYLGGSLRLIEGQLPYKDFAFIQPPGIVLLMTPVALVAKIFTTVKGLALARVLTVVASAACVPLAGNLVRYRGTVVTVVTCGVLAVYPGDVTAAHTLLLEPWMNLVCLLAINAAFRRGHLARPGRLAWAGLALGFACSIKFWAAAPAAVLLVICLLHQKDRARRVRAYLLTLAVGFVAPVLPFFASAPMTFIRSTITDQVVREGTPVSIGVRLANLTGLIDIIDKHGRVSLNAGAQSLYSAGALAGLGRVSLGWLPWGAAAVLGGAIAAGYIWQSRRLSELEWLSLATAVLAVGAVLVYSAFFYHYPDFPAPWLALSLGGASGALAGHLAWRKIVVGAVAVVLTGVALLQVRETFPLQQSTAEGMAHLIAPGSCLVTDQASLAIAADRFAGPPPGCPDIVDSLASTLVLSNGVSVQGGAARMPHVVAAWRSWLGAADYVWFSPGNAYKRRIPWTPALTAWFYTHFTKETKYSPGIGQLYVRTRR